MYRVTVSSGFSAAHRLRLADGTLERMHGHDWSVEARFVGSELDASGVLIDFEEVQRVLQQIVGSLHHTDLNECELLAGTSPSAENVARVICEAVAQGIASPDLLESVHVVEAPGCTASYFRPEHALRAGSPRPVDGENGHR